MEESIGTHPDLTYKAEIDAIADKQDGDIYVYPSLVELGESDVWHPMIHGESENTLDLGGQHAPNTVAVKQLAGRTNHNKNRIDRLENLGGMKNLWIDGSMQIWDDGLTGEITENYNPRYAYNMMVLRHHSYVIDGVMTGVQGSTYTWEQISDTTKSWLKITHVGALEYGYIGQRWDLPTLSYLKGKTVSISFLYKTNIYTVGHVSFYSEQNAIHDGVAQGDVMATSEEYTIVGDGNIHKIETTVTLLDDNIVPDPSGYVGILLTYGTLADGIPDGYIQFTDIQVEVNDKCTDYEFTNLALTREKMNYYYRKGSTGYYDASSPSGNKYISVEFGTDMRVVPAVTNDSIWVTGATAGTIPTAITKKGFMLNAPDNTAIGCYWTADARMY